MISLDVLKPRRLATRDGVAAANPLNRLAEAGYRAQPATFRASLLVAATYALLILTAWLLMSGRYFPAARRNANLTAIDISHDVPKPDAPAKPAIVPPVPDSHMVALIPSKLTIEAAPPATGNGCSVSNAVGAALLADPEAMAELASLPPEVRSDADAVMLWNGTWLDVAPEAQAQMASSPIPALKRAVRDAVLALPAECQEVEVTGPQLIPIPEPGRTTMVVIGSGVWRWASLLGPPEDPDATGLPDQLAANKSAPLGLSGN